MITGAGPLVNDAGAEVDQWVALLCDDKKVDAPCRTLYTQDTMWMNILVELIWDRAKVVTT